MAGVFAKVSGPHGGVRRGEADWALGSPLADSIVLGGVREEKVKRGLLVAPAHELEGSPRTILLDPPAPLIV